MTRALAISQRQTQILIRAAEAEDAVIEVKLGKTIIRLIPKSRVSMVPPALDDDEDLRF